MGANIVQYKDKNDNLEYPRTTADAVGMPDGSGSLTKKLLELEERGVPVEQTFSTAPGSENKTLSQRAVSKKVEEIDSFIGMKEGNFTEITDTLSIKHSQRYGEVGGKIQEFAGLEYESTYLLKNSDNYSVDLKARSENSSAVQYVDSSGNITRLDLVRTFFDGLYEVKFQDGETGVYVSSFNKKLRVYKGNKPESLEKRIGDVAAENLIIKKSTENNTKDIGGLKLNVGDPSLTDVTDKFRKEVGQRYGKVGSEPLLEVSSDYENIKVLNDGNNYSVRMRALSSNSSMVQYLDEAGKIKRLDIQNQAFDDFYNLVFKVGEKSAYVSSYRTQIKVKQATDNPLPLSDRVSNLEKETKELKNNIGEISLINISYKYKISPNQIYGVIGGKPQTDISSSYTNTYIKNDGKKYTALLSRRGGASANIVYVDSSNTITHLSAGGNGFDSKLEDLVFQEGDAGAYVSSADTKVQVYIMPSDQLNAIGDTSDVEVDITKNIKQYGGQSYGEIGGNIEIYSGDTAKHIIVDSTYTDLKIQITTRSNNSSNVQYVDSKGKIVRLDFEKRAYSGFYTPVFRKGEAKAYINSYAPFLIVKGREPKIMQQLKELRERGSSNNGTFESVSSFSTGNLVDDIKKNIASLVQRKRDIASLVEYKSYGILRGQGGAAVGQGLKNGIIYSDCYEVDKYVFFDVSLHTYLTAVNNPYSLMYTEDLQHNKSGYGFIYNGAGTDGNIGGYMGTVCNNFAMLVAGFNIGYGLGAFKYLVKKGILKKIFVQKAQYAQVGYILWTSSHAQVITDVEKSDEGFVSYVTISESVGNFPVSTKLTAKDFNSRLNSYVMYGFRQINDSRMFPVSPFYKQDGTLTNGYLYNDDICTYAGDKAAFRKGQKIFINYNLKAVGDWSQVELYKDDNLLKTFSVTSSSHNLDLTGENLDFGIYKARMKNSGGHSEFTYFEVIDANASVQITEGSKIRISFNSKEGFPMQFNACKLSGAPKAYYAITDEERDKGFIDVDIKALIAEQYNNLGDGETYIKVFFEGTFGRVTCEWIKIVV